MANQWSDKLTSTRRTVWNQWNLFRLANFPEVPEVCPEGTPYVLFLQSLQVASVYRYAVTLRRILELIEGERVPRPALSHFVAALDTEALTHEPRQALPMARAWMEAHWGTTDPHTQLGLWIAWKTASRWAEIHELVRGSFVALTNDDAVVHFGFQGRVKTARRQRTKNAIQHFVHLRARSDELRWMSALNTAIRRTPQGDPIFPKTTASMEAWLAQMPADPEMLTECEEEHHLTHYTCHSLKVGALRALAKLGEQGLVTQTAIGLLAKHKADASPLPKSTVGYLRRVPAMTRMGETGAATLLL
jgi:hypothetical protein